jgi:hypothetical protein
MPKLSQYAITIPRKFAVKTKEKLEPLSWAEESSLTH